MVMRARFPGSKFDLCLVLEGEQGCGKSSLLRALAAAPGEGYFVDAPGLVAMDNKTRAELVAGKWLVELAELSGLAKSETEGVKAFLSQSSDQYRPPYGAVAVDRPRRCIFVATTNARTYLPDATGNRRFLPVPCLRIDLKALLAERDQLFAEAQVMVSRMLREPLKSGRVHQGHALPQDLAAKFALPPSLWSEAAALADERRVVDPVEEALPDVVQGAWSRVRSIGFPTVALSFGRRTCFPGFALTMTGKSETMAWLAGCSAWLVQGQVSDAARARNEAMPSRPPCGTRSLTVSERHAFFPSGQALRSLRQ